MKQKCECDLKPDETDTQQANSMPDPTAINIRHHQIVAGVLQEFGEPKVEEHRRGFSLFGLFGYQVG